MIIELKFAQVNIKYIITPVYPSNTVDMRYFSDYNQYDMLNIQFTFVRIIHMSNINTESVRLTCDKKKQ